MRSRIALGTLLVATTVSLTVTVTGLAGVTGKSTPEFLAPPAAAAELVPFEDCEALLQWYVEQALPEVGPYGLGGWSMGLRTASPSGPDLATMGGAIERSEAPVADTSDPAPSSGTGTNVQEVGVDEPDRAKTDGELVVHVRGKELGVTDVTGAQPREVGSLPLPDDLVEAELLLAGDTVLVLGPQRTPGGRGPMPTDVVIDRVMPYPAPIEGRSRLLEVSIADPAAPRLVSDQGFGGALVSARQHGDAVRLVLSTAQPVIDFVQPNRERTEKEAIEENRQLLRESTIEDWLPMTTAGDGDGAEPLVDCADVRHPSTGSGYGTVTVVTFDAAEPTQTDALGVTTSSQTVYSSTERLYLATAARKNTTDVHAFALDGTTTSYAASGNVDGVVADRWSMDEHDGVLRLAVAHGPGWSPKENGVTTLRERGDQLVVAGSVRGLGPREQIKSVRWFDDLAIVVTFRQTDPLYTVDLTAPASPRTLGELKIPGFSEYLHPIGDDRLLGLGQHATMRGEILGGQASLFDVGDLAAPQRLATLDLGKHAQPWAGLDPRTFTWLADRGRGLAVVEDQWNGRAWLMEIRVEGDSLAEGQRWSLPRWKANQGRALPLPDGSVALVGSTVELVELG